MLLNKIKLPKAGFCTSVKKRKLSRAVFHWIFLNTLSSYTHSDTILCGMKIRSFHLTHSSTKFIFCNIIEIISKTTRLTIHKLFVGLLVSTLSQVNIEIIILTLQRSLKIFSLQDIHLLREGWNDCLNKVKIYTLKCWNNSAISILILL